MAFTKILINYYYIRISSSLGESADLQVLIGGMSVRGASCIGENITYVCNIASVAHSWRFNGGPGLAVIRTPRVVFGYTIQMASIINGTYSIITFSDII